MDNEIKILSEKSKKLIHSNFISFQDVASLKSIMGVYVIYNHKKDVLYVGSTNKFHVRFGTDLKYESTHTLVGKLIKSGEFEDRKKAVDYLINRCSIKIVECSSKREAEALEHIMIYILNPLYNK